MLSLLFGACHTGYDPSWEHTVSPSGRPAFILECSRTAWCIELAGDLCPRGYTVLQAGSEHDYDPQAQVRQNVGASIAKTWPAYMGHDVRYASIECAGQDSPSPPPKVTVTRNAPAEPARRPVATDAGF